MASQEVSVGNAIKFRRRNDIKVEPLKWGGRFYAALHDKAVAFFRYLCAIHMVQAEVQAEVQGPGPAFITEMVILSHGRCRVTIAQSVHTQILWCLCKEFVAVQ